MKFSHEFKEALHREGFPEHWVNSAIPYGQLKKLINKVVGELNRLGLDPQTLSGLITAGGEDNQTRRGSGDAPIAFQYNFSGRKCLANCSKLVLADIFAEDAETVIPKLTLYVQLEDGIAVDATLSPDTRKYLEGLAVKHSKAAGKGENNAQEDMQSRTEVLLQ